MGNAGVLTEPLPVLAILPVLAWISAYFSLPIGGFRARVLATTTVWAALAVLAIELLNLFEAIRPVPVAAFWLAVASTGLYFRRRTPIGISSRFHPLYTLAVAMGVLVAVTSLCSPPNTADAITYHAPRVFFWAQHGSLAFYPTEQLTQLLLTPGAEFLSLHFQVLLGSDRLLPLPQLLLYLHAILAASLIARYLGASESVQAAAAVLVATIPEGVLQASGAKNDFAAAGWLMAASVFLLAYRTDPQWKWVGLAGLAIGLGLLTKSTLLLWLPAAGVFFLSSIRFRHTVLAGVCVVGLNAPQVARYHEFTGSYFGATPEMPGGTCRFQNDRINARTFVSNSVRNIALHLSTPWKDVNTGAENAAKWAIDHIGMDPNDPSNTWCGQTFSVPPFVLDEIQASNLGHLLLIGLALPILLWRPGQGRWAAAALLSAAVLFCLLLQWQPWHTRLHIMFFVFGAAIASVAFPPRVTVALSLVAFAGAIPYALWNETRPLLGERSVLAAERADIYYYGRMMHQAPSRRALEILKRSGCARIALANHSDNYHYPLMMELRQAIPSVEFQYVNPRNSSTRFRAPVAAPCAVICFGCGGRPDLWANYTQIAKGVSEADHITVFSANAPSVDVASFACRLRWGAEWYPPETGENGTWRWSEQGGTVLVEADAETEIVVAGSLLSLNRPNNVGIFWNGRKTAEVSAVIGGDDGFSLPLLAKPGPNLLEFRANAKPVQPPGDSRRLGLGILALRAEDKSGALACR